MGSIIIRKVKNLQVKKSRIHGLGVFATKPVEKSKRIFFLTGKICKKYNKNNRDALSHSCWIGIKKNVWINPDYPFRYINHSCNPSAGIRGKITVVALRALNPGDEITLDYSLIEADPRWQMECECGDKKCRHVIRAVGFLETNTFERYLPFVPTYFKNVYLSSKDKGHN